MAWRYQALEQQRLEVDGAPTNHVGKNDWGWVGRSGVGGAAANNHKVESQLRNCSGRDSS